MDSVQKTQTSTNVESHNAGGMSFKQFDKTFNELRAIQSSVKKFKPGDLVIPLLSLMSLGILTAFVYIPMVSKGIEYREETASVKEKVAQLQRLNTTLNGIDVSKQQSDLTDSRAVIPFSLQVSDFVSYVDQEAKNQKLEFREILAGDIIIRSNNQSKSIDPVAKGVSGPLKYYGKLDQITAFLDIIQDASPFILSADQIKIKQSNGEDRWELSVNITGYYINKSALPKVNIYNSFSSYTQYDSVVEIFKEKAARLNSGS